jgi:hypothetical protein
MNKKILFGVLIFAGGTVISEGIFSPHKIDIILAGHHMNDHLPERPPYNNTTRTSLSITSVVTSTVTTTTAPYSL